MPATEPSEFACPDAAVLSELLAGRGTEVETAELFSHLDHCDACGQKLRDAANAEDPLVALLRQTPTRLAFANDDACRAFQDLLLGLAPPPQALAVQLPPNPPQPPAPTPASKPIRIGPYELINALGGNGLGRTYRARVRSAEATPASRERPDGGPHDVEQADAVVKLLTSRQSGDGQTRALLLAALEAIRRVRHPHIAEVFSVGWIDDVPYKAREWIDGCCVGELVAALGPLPVADACEIARQACQGLQGAHDQGALHGRVKPSNVMLDLQGRVKLLDLGLAGLPRDTAADRATLGTLESVLDALECLAPEQNDTRPADPRCDLYCLGATLFTMLAGRAPFPRGKNEPPHVARARMREAAVDLRSLRDDLPAAAVRLAAQLLEKDPARRPASARDVSDALSKCTPGADLAALVHRVKPSPG